MSARPATLLVCDHAATAGDWTCPVVYCADTPRVREARAEAQARAGWWCVRAGQYTLDLCPRHAAVRRDALEGRTAK